MTVSPRRMLVVPALMALSAACGPESPETPSGVGAMIAAHRLTSEGPRFSDWSAPINLGPPVNTALVELNPAISKDGLSLYFTCDGCPGGLGGIDIWVSQRATLTDPWGPPQNLGPVINTADNDAGPSLSRDGRTLYFISNRPGGLGGNDIYVAQRRDKHDDLSWEAPVHLGNPVNSAANDGAPNPFVDRNTGTTILYFTSNRPGGLGGGDIYTSVLGADGTFGPATLVAELSSAFADQGTAVRRDGLEIIFASDRPGTLGGLDLWVSTRLRTSDPWSPPVHLGPTLNGTGNDAGAELSFDGTTLYFQSAERPGNVGGPFFDIWVATRDKLRGADGDHDDGDDDADASRRSHR
jgi:hypothetical protein